MSDPPGRAWTPEPEPFESDKYIAWGKKHYGRDWFNLREQMLNERDSDIYRAEDDDLYQSRQRVLREMEATLEQGHLQFPEARTWEEVQEWAAANYGYVWYKEARRLASYRRREAEAEDAEEKSKMARAVDKQKMVLWPIQNGIDREKCEKQGISWREIMALPGRPPKCPPRLGYTGVKHRFKGPPRWRHIKARHGLDSAERYAWCDALALETWDWLAWTAINKMKTKEEYEKEKARLEKAIVQSRSRREDVEAKIRFRRPPPRCLFADSDSDDGLTEAETWFKPPGSTETGEQRKAKSPGLFGDLRGPDLLNPKYPRLFGDLGDSDLPQARPQAVLRNPLFRSSRRLLFQAPENKGITSSPRASAAAELAKKPKFPLSGPELHTRKADDQGEAWPKRQRKVRFA